VLRYCKRRNPARTVRAGIPDWFWGGRHPRA
jgi:hypothetical protein